MKISEILKEFDTKLGYHSDLNPKIWDKDGNEYKIKKDVSERLLSIGKQFASTLQLDLDVISDYVFTGSNANFNWTSLSDLDVHLTLDQSKLENCINCLTDFEDCLQAKKSLWNDRHEITIYGHEVEVYVTSNPEKLVSDSGSYSLLKNEWIKRPEYKQISYDTETVIAKSEEIAAEIDMLISSKTNDEEDIQELLDKISKMRSCGLEREGEFSVENLTFKSLRNNGYIDKIRQYSIKAKDNSLSIK